MNDAIITYFGQPARVICDRNCAKAWVLRRRPKIQLSDYPYDYAYLADEELDIAPVDPGTREGDVAKPLSPDAFPTKWCVRECERCARSKPGEFDKDLALPDFSQRLNNMTRLHDDDAKGQYLNDTASLHLPISLWTTDMGRLVTADSCEQS